jgi:hypothetical protein
MMREGVPLSWVWPSSQAIPESPGNFLDTKSILTLLKESEVNDVKEQEKAPEELGTEILGLILEHHMPASHKLPGVTEEEIVRLISLGADLEVRCNELAKATPLWYLAYRGSREIIGCMIKRGARLDAADVHGGTPLSRAAYLGATDNVRALVEAGADPNPIFKKGKSTLLVSVEANGMGLFYKGHPDPIVIDSVDSVKALIEAGADPRTAFDSMEEFTKFFSGDVGWVPEEAMQRMRKVSRARGAFGRF